MQPIDEPRTCTRINRPSTECTAHNLHCGAPECFAPQTTPSTPPQPQPAPLHPLELLADWLEAYDTCLSIERGRMRSPEAYTAHQAARRTERQLFGQLMGLDPAALRAQAAALAAAEADRDALRAALGGLLALYPEPEGLHRHSGQLGGFRSEVVRLIDSARATMRDNS